VPGRLFDRPLATLRHWIADRAGGGYLLLLGPPGQGKSALLARLAAEEAVAGCLLHMVKSQRHPGRFVPALLSQAARLSGRRFGADAYRGDLDTLRESLVKGLEAVRQVRGRTLVVLDALDELEERPGQVRFLPAVLPEGVRVVLSCRPDVPRVQALRQRLRGLEERPLEPFSLASFRELLKARLGTEVVQALQGRVHFPELFERVGGNALLLGEMVTALRQRWQAHGVALRFRAEELPATLEGVFRAIYDRVRGVRDAAGRRRGRLLQLLAVAREALSAGQLAELLSMGETAATLEECRDGLEEVSAYLQETGHGRYKPWHQGLVDHIRRDVLGPAGVVREEGLFARWLAEGTEGGGYGLRHRVGHLLAAGRAEEAAELLWSWHCLEAKAEAGLVYELAADFRSVAAALPEGQRHRRPLELVEEALNRDLQFLARYPRTLFQCLWNTAWWYDSPTAAGHYVLPPREQREELPWERTERPLSAWLETWLLAKETKEPGFVWVRSLRPPALNLGSALKKVFRGHEGGVWSVSYSPDGSRIVSGSDDQTVRVWETVTGQQLLCLQGHDGQVSSVSYSPDGSRIVTGSHDQTVRVWDAVTGPSPDPGLPQLTNGIFFSNFANNGGGLFNDSSSPWLMNMTFRSKQSPFSVQPYLGLRLAGGAQSQSRQQRLDERRLRPGRACPAGAAALSTGGEPQMQRGTGLVLLRGMDLNLGVAAVQGLVASLAGQGLPITFAAEVQLDQVPQTAGRRARQYRPYQLGGLEVGQVALIAQHPGNQLRPPAAGTLQGLVVVELHGQQIDVGQGGRQGLVPATKIGHVAEGRILAEQVALAFQTKTKGRPAIVADPQYPATQRRSQVQLLASFEQAHQAGLVQLLIGWSRGAKIDIVLGMAIEGNVVAVQMGQGAILPVVGVGMCQQHGPDRCPGQAGPGEALRQLARPQADVDQDAKVRGFDQRGIAPTSAGQYGETQPHPRSFAIDFTISSSYPSRNGRPGQTHSHPIGTVASPRAGHDRSLSAESPGPILRPGQPVRPTPSRLPGRGYSIHRRPLWAGF